MNAVQATLEEYRQQKRNRSSEIHATLEEYRKTKRGAQLNTTEPLVSAPRGSGKYSSEVTDIYSEILNQQDITPVSANAPANAPAPKPQSDTPLYERKFLREGGGGKRDNELLIPQMLSGAVSVANALPKAGQWGTERLWKQGAIS